MRNLSPLSSPHTACSTAPASVTALAGYTVVALKRENAARGILPLIPLGEFRALDGRPADAPCWTLSAARAGQIKDHVEARAAAGTRMVIDYEHQTLLAKNNGQPAPAAAWVSKLAVIDNVLCSVDTEFTDRARQMIEAGEYAYISPVFAYDKSGAVKMLAHASLTNTPALDGMAIAALSSQPLLSLMAALGDNMDDLIERLRWMLNLPVSAAAAEIKAELEKLIGQLGADTAAASFNVLASVAVLKSQVGAAPDPARFVPMDVHAAVSRELGEMRQAALARQVDELVAPALADGRLMPAEEKWARELGASNVASLSSLLAVRQPLAALSGSQTGGRPPAGGAGAAGGRSGGGALSDEQLAVCKNMGITPEAFAAATA